MPIAAEIIATELSELIAELSQIQAEIRAYVQKFAEFAEQVDATRRPSVHNLLSYLALRRRDLRQLQPRLTRQGLSSLGRTESHVSFTLDAVLRALHALAGHSSAAIRDALPDEVDCESGPAILQRNAVALLGPGSTERSARIMVTMPSEAADDPAIILALLRNGMDCLRINCAHDGPPVWLRMIEHLRSAERALGKQCRICMDLAGPKLRTGPLEPTPGVLKLKPQRDASGRVVTPAKILFTTTALGVAKKSRPTLPVRAAPWWSELKPGDRLSLRDARDSRREFVVAAIDAQGVWVTTEKTCYLAEGTELYWQSPGHSNGEPPTQVAPLPPRAGEILLQPNDVLVLTRSLAPGRAATTGEPGGTATPAFIGCTLPEVFEQVRVGERIALDDGKFLGVLERVAGDSLQVRITQAPPAGAKLRSDKGINLPDSTLRVTPLTGKDREDLAFIVQQADMVAFSFASSAGDVRLLREQIERLGPRRPAIVLKIETRLGFEHLPAMLFEALRTPCCGVMIARGDLAVECGFERLAEIQEEILWICEAAHVPVIWATQVLEKLAQEGLPSRAEITDAAMSNRAECVMLNKGPQIVRAVQMLDNILRRMRAHHSKKSSMLRELQLAHGLSLE